MRKVARGRTGLLQAAIARIAATRSFEGSYGRRQGTCLTHCSSDSLILRFSHNVSQTASKSHLGK